MLPSKTIVIDVAGDTLTREDKKLLQNPLVSGVILFERNCVSYAQLQQLIQAIKSVRSLPLKIIIDQEGGSVQRMRHNVTQLPFLSELGILYDQDQTHALAMTQAIARTTAEELLELGVDINLGPMLDLRNLDSNITAQRAFHANPYAVYELALAYIQGSKSCGMPTVGKHFPGHGIASQDSHMHTITSLAKLEQLSQRELIPFLKLIHTLDAIMPAHIIFPEVCQDSVTFSTKWLQEILRNDYNFTGQIVSDDLSMLGAKNLIPAPSERLARAFAAGIDVALFCNDRFAVTHLLL